MARNRNAPFSVITGVPHSKICFCTINSWSYVAVCNYCVLLHESKEIGESIRFTRPREDSWRSTVRVCHRLHEIVSQNKFNPLGSSHSADNKPCGRLSLRYRKGG
ncbi:unnamed protein product, partial [Scytosiphon promiscuus]